MGTALTYRERMELTAQRNMLKKLNNRRPKLVETTERKLAAAASALKQLDEDITLTEQRIRELEAKDGGAVPTTTPAAE